MMLKRSLRYYPSVKGIYAHRGFALQSNGDQCLSLGRIQEKDSKTALIV